MSVFFEFLCKICRKLYILAVAQFIQSSSHCAIMTYLYETPILANACDISKTQIPFLQCHIRPEFQYLISLISNILQFFITLLEVDGLPRR